MDLVAPQSNLTRSHGCLYEPNDNHRIGSQYVGFEQMWQNNNYHSEVFTINLKLKQIMDLNNKLLKW